MFLAKAILFAVTAVSPAQIIEDEEIQLAQELAILEEEEIDGEIVFEEEDLLILEDEFKDLHVID